MTISSWTGVTGDWSDPDDWSPQGVPNNVTTNVVFNQGTATAAFIATVNAGSYQLDSLALNTALALLAVHGTLDFSGSTDHSVTITAGTLAIENSGTLLGAPDISLSADGTLDISGDGQTAGQAQVIGSLSGAGTVVLGNEALAIGADNSDSTFSGTITADANGAIAKIGTGTLTLDNALMTGGLGNGGFYVYQGALAENAGSSTLFYLAVGEGAGSDASVSLTGGTLSIGGGDPNSGAGLQIGDFGGTGIFNQSGGTLVVDGGLNVGNQGGKGTYNLSGGALSLVGGTLNIGRNTSSWDKSTGALNISGSGLVDISAGLLIIGDWVSGSSVATTGSGTISQTGGALEIDAAGRFYLSSFGNGEYDLLGGTLEVGGSNGISGNFGNAGGSYTFKLGGGTIAVVGSALATGVDATLVAGSTSTINLNGLGASFSGAITGSGSLDITGTGAATFADLATTGLVEIDSGATLNIAAGKAASVGALSGTGTLQVNGTLDLSADTTTSIGALIGSGTVILGNDTLYLGAGNASSTFAGTITATRDGAIYQVGTGSVTLNSVSMTMTDMVEDNSGYYVYQGSLIENSGNSNIYYLAVGEGTGNQASANLAGGTLTILNSLQVGDWGGTGIFDQTGGTLILANSLNIGNQGGTGIYNLSGGTMLLNGPSQVFGIGRNTAGHPASTGTINISGTGLLDIHAGELVIGDRVDGGVGTEGSGAIVQTGGIFDVEIGTRLDLAGYGNGEYDLNGGTLEIGGTSLNANFVNGAPGTYAFNLGGGTIAVTGSALSTSVNATLVTGTTSTLDLNGLGATLSGAVTGAGSLDITGTGTATFAGLATTGLVELDGTTLNIAAGTTASVGSIAGTGTLRVNGTLDLSVTTTASVGALTGTGTVILGNHALKVGAGDASSTFSGTIIAGSNGEIDKIGAGTITLASAKMSTGAFYVLDGSLAEATGSSSIYYLAIGEGNGNTSSGTLSGGTLTIANSFQIGDYGGTGTFVQSGGTLVANYSLNIGNQGGTGIYQLEAGTLLLGGSGANLYNIGHNGGSNPASSGTLAISGGLLDQVLGEVVIGDLLSATVEGSGTILQTGGDYRVEAGNLLTLSGFGHGEYDLNGGTLQVGGNSLRANFTNGPGDYAFNIGGGTIQVTGSALSTAVNATLTSGTSSTIDTNNLGATWSGALSGAGELIKVGLGTLVLAGDDSLSSGILDIAAGTVQLAASGTLSASNDVTIAASGTLDLHNTKQTIGSLAGSGAVLLGTGTLTAGGDGANTIFSGALSGSGKLIKAGSGTLTLSGNDSGYTGSVEIDDGTLQIDAAHALPALTDVTIGPSGTLDISAAGTVVVLDAVSTSGAILLGNQVMEIGAGNSSSTLSGMIVAGRDGVIVQAGTGTVTLNSVSMTMTDATEDNSGYYVYQGSLTEGSGSSSIYYLAIGEGAGNTGTASLTGGTLAIGNSLQLGDFGGSGTFNQSGGTLAVDGSFNIGNQGGSGTYTIGSGTLLLESSVGLYNLGHNNGTHAAGSGTLNITGGLVDVSAGELILGDRENSTIGNGSGTITQTGGTLEVDTGASLVLSAYGSGEYDLNGGTLEIGGASLRRNYTGATGNYAFNLGGGTIVVTGSALISNVNATLVAGTTSTLNLGTLGATLSGSIGGSGTLDIIGNNKSVVQLPNLASTVVLDIINGTLDIGSGGVNATLANTVHATSNGEIDKIGAGTLTLAGANMDGGALYVLAGSLAESAGSSSIHYLAIGEGTGNTASGTLSGGTLTIANSFQIGDYGGTGRFVQTGGTLVANYSLNIGNQGGTGIYQLEAGTLLLGGSGDNLYNIGHNGGSNPASSGTLVISGGLLDQVLGEVVIGDLLSTTVEGSGTILQTGGDYRVEAGNLLALSGFGHGEYDLNGGTLEIGGNSLQANFTNGPGDYAFNIGGGTIQVTGSALSTAVNATLTSGTSSTIDTNNLGATWSGALSGGGELIKVGLGTLVLSGNDSGYTGTLEIDQDTVQLGTSGTRSAATDVSVGASGTLDISNTTQTIGDLAGSGTVLVGTGTLIAGGDGKSTTFSGTLAGSGEFIKTGSGTLVLAGADTTGSLEVDGGTLRLGAPGTLAPSIDVTIGAGGTLDISNTTQTIDVLSGSGALLIGQGSLKMSSGSFSGILTNAGILQALGPLNLTGGTLTNQLTGSITGDSGASPSALIAAGATVVNSGLISNTSPNGTTFGVYLEDDGFLSNTGTVTGAGGVGATSAVHLVSINNTGVIAGIGSGVDISGAGSAGVINGGLIQASQSGGFGVQLDAIVDDLNNTGTIRGSTGVEFGGGSGTTNTLTNAGTIIGTDGTAVQFGSGTDRLIIDPNAYFGGKVDGSGGVDTLELAQGTSGGTLSGLGSTFTGFEIIVVDTGANWTLAGSNTIDSGTTLTLDHATLSAAGTLENDGAILLDPSTLSVGALVGSGTVTIDGGSTFDVLGSITVGETIAFTNTTGLLELESPATAAGVIAGFVTGDTIDLINIAHHVTDQANLLAGNTLEVTTTSGTFDFRMAGDFSGEYFHLTDNGSGGSDITVDATPCYCRGTLILTDKGEVGVEDLTIGDLVITLSGAAKPIKWIGRRGYNGRFVAGNRRVQPILIRAGALQDAVPRRDLYVSPLHAMLLDDVLVPAELLVNGATILRCDTAQTVEYFHIELDVHDIIIADGAPAETYVDCDNRGTFHNAHEFGRLYPDDLPAKRAFCAARVEDGDRLADIRRKLAERFEAFGYTTTFDPDLRLMVDGCPVDANVAQNFVYRFELAKSPREVRLVSRTSVPDDIKGGWADPRRLGVNLHRIVLRNEHLQIVVDHRDSSLRDGFHEAEATHLWTNGDALIPSKFLAFFEDALTIEVHLLNHPLPYLDRLQPNADQLADQSARSATG